MSNHPDWEVAHYEVVRLAGERAALEHALAGALLRALRANVWQAMGMASFFEYAERFVGLSPRQTEERLRVSQALEDLPRLSSTLAEGRLPFSAVRELTRVVTPQTEEAWLEAAAGKSVPEIERLVAGHKPGDEPDDPPQPEARRHRIILDVSADTYATYREAQAMVRRDTEDKLTEEDGLLLMCRAVLAGPADPGRSSYQIQMTLCEACGRATQDGRGQEIPVDATAAELAQCDAQRLDKTGKATQDIPPATRRLVMRRHHGRCAVPGCRNSRFTDVHHVHLRSEGGTHDPENLLCMCSVHHMAVHRGALLIEGTWATGLTFRHADGSSYGAPASPHAAAILSDVHQALTGLGFKEREARRMVETVRPQLGADATTVDAVRCALRGWQAAAPM
jgi:hypothetical protein